MTEKEKRNKEKYAVLKTNILRLIAAAAVILLAIYGIRNLRSGEEIPELTAGSFSAPGTYTASAQGYAGPVEVTAVFNRYQVTNITIRSDEDPEIGKIAMSEMASRIVSGQSLYTDTVSGATVSGRAFQDAFQVCCSEAGADEETMAMLLDGIEKAKAQAEMAAAEEEKPEEEAPAEPEEEKPEEPEEEVEEVQQEEEPEEEEEEEEEEPEGISHIDAIIAAEHFWGHYPSEQPAGYDEGYVYDTYISGYPSDDYPYYIITLIIANYEEGIQQEYAKARVDMYTGEAEAY
jgi:uncharacterized protein with FMN-binding domain